MAQTRTAVRGENIAIAMRRSTPAATRATLSFGDFTDCLLQAYDGVARRAYQKFIARGSTPGCELDDWLAAEQELATNMHVDVEESESFVCAMVSLSGSRNAEVSVAVEGRWLMVMDAQEFACQGAPAAMLGAMEWNSETGAAVVAPEWSGRLAHFCVSRGSASCDDGADPDEVDERESLRVRWGSPPFCVVELPADVDRARSACVLADGILAVRMTKSSVGAC